MSRLNKINQNRSRQIVHERTRDEKEPARYPGLIYFLILLLLSGLAYLLFFSGVLGIKEVVISDCSRMAELRETVDSYRSTHLLGNNILFINTGELEALIGEDTHIKSVEVKREFPNRIKVVVSESVGAVLWNTAGESFIVDERGYVIEKNNNEVLPPVFDNVNIPVTPGERVASPTFIKYIIDISNNFELITGVQMEKIIILDILSDVHVKSKSTWTVYLDSTKDPIAQLENLNKVLHSARESGHTRLRYIDMRLQDKVFYK